MPLDYGQIVEQGDSSTVHFFSAAAASRGETHNPFPSSQFERRAAKFLTTLPVRVQNTALEWMVGFRGASPSQAGSIQTEDLCRWMLGKGYGETEGDYPLIFIGAPSGAAAFLAALYRCPLITDRFLISFKSRNHPDDAEAYAQKGASLGRALSHDRMARRIVHYDPLHDRFLIKRVTHLRLRLLQPLEAMKGFIRQRLRPGGKVILLQCGYQWPQYDLGDGLKLQVGGLGGVPPEEFTSDSSRLRAFRQASGGMRDRPWSLERNLTVEPESEWGSEPAFGESLQDFCGKEGIDLLTLRFGHPHELSEIALRAYKLHFASCRQKVRGLYVSCFTNLDAGFAMDTGLLPLWLPFNCEDSFTFLGSVIKRLLPHWEVWIALHPSFCRPLDIVDIRHWRQALEKFKSLHWLGTDPARFPADIMSYFRFFEQTVRLKKEMRTEIDKAEDTALLQSSVDSLDLSAEIVSQ